MLDGSGRRDDPPPSPVRTPSSESRSTAAVPLPLVPGSERDEAMVTVTA